MANTSAFADALEKASKETGQYIKNAVKGQTFDGSDKAINKVASTLGNNFFGVPEAAYRIATGEGIRNSFVRTFGRGVQEEIVDGATRLVAKEGLDYGKIAGSYIGAAAAGRVISGGGVYKDGQGRANLIGVPFV